MSVDSRIMNGGFSNLRSRSRRWLDHPIRTQGRNSACRSQHMEHGLRYRTSPPVNTRSAKCGLQKCLLVAVFSPLRQPRAYLQCLKATIPPCRSFVCLNLCHTTLRPLASSHSIRVRNEPLRWEVHPANTFSIPRRRFFANQITVVIL